MLVKLGIAYYYYCPNKINQNKRRKTKNYFTKFWKDSGGIQPVFYHSYPVIDVKYVWVRKTFIVFISIQSYNINLTKNKISWKGFRTTAILCVNNVMAYHLSVYAFLIPFLKLCCPSISHALLYSKCALWRSDRMTAVANWVGRLRFL